MDQHQWYAFVALLPSRVDRPFDTDAAIEIFTGQMELVTDEGQVPLDGTVKLYWAPRPHIRADASGDVAFDLALPEGELRMPGFLPVRAMIASRHRSGKATEVGLSLMGQLHPDDSGLERCWYMSVVNFPEHSGRLVRTPEGGASRTRLAFKRRDLEISIDQVCDIKERIGRAKLESGTAVTHQIRVSGPTPITRESMQRVLDHLHLFLGFCRGLWCGPILLSPDSGDVARTSFGPWILPTWKDPESWFPVHRPEGVEDIFARLGDRLEDPVWEDTIRNAIQWYVSSNSAPTVDEAVIQTLIAFELLGWTTLVKDAEVMSSRDYRSLSAEQGLRSLLTHLGIPAGPPEHLPSLRKVADQLIHDAPNRVVDGPRLVCYIRNCIVHPNPRRRELIRSLGGRGLWEVKALALKYLELAVLRLLEYSGPYRDRTLLGGWVGDTQVVPWDSA